MLEFVKKEDEPAASLQQHQQLLQLSKDHPTNHNNNNNSNPSTMMSSNNTIKNSNSNNNNSSIKSGSGGGGGGGGYHVCSSCKSTITTRWLFKMFSCSEDTYFHEECLTCSVCSIQLATTCFYRNEKLYCKFDYNRIFNNEQSRALISKSCSKCNELIQTNELVMKVEKSHIYHLHCFTCTICCTQLQKGDEFVLRGAQLFCRADYEKEQQQLLFYQSQQLSPRGDENNRPRDGRRGPKRPRTILTSTQRRQFKASFEVSPKPCRKVREGLAKETGLSVRVVQVWFQNQRAKMKKIQRKSGNSKPEDSSKENKDDKHGEGGGRKRDPDDSCSSADEDDEEGGSRSCYDTDGPFTPGLVGGPRNPNLPYSPDDYNSNDESFICSSEISFEEDSNAGLEASEHGGGGGGIVGLGAPPPGIVELHNLSNSRSSSSSGDPSGGGGGGPYHHHGHHHHHHHSHHHHPSHHHLPHPGLLGQPSSGGSSSSVGYASGGGGGPQSQPSINPIDKLYLMQNSYFNNSANE